MIQTAVTHARTVFMVLVLLLIAGVYSYITIPKESSPDVPIPTIYVSVNHEGISPEDAVNLLLKPLEEEMRGLDGLDEMEGTAYEGGANLVLNFIAGFDNEAALDDVREKVDLARPELPEDADEPVVTEINISLFPILTVILAGDVPEREMKRLAENLQDRLESLPGVLEAKINGLREEMLLIEIDRAKLESFDLDPETLISRIAANNRLIAAGSLELTQGRYGVKVPGLFRSAEEVLDLPLLTDGLRSVRIRDIGTVKRTFKDPATITRVDGHSAVTLEISKRIGENIIETVDAVKASVAEERESWPESMTHRFVNDESDVIRQRLMDLQNNVITAVLLVMIVVLAALGGRSAFLVATTVPGAFLTAMLLLSAFGFTTNVVVLFALILSVGLLVDGAIVVTELADTKLMTGARRQPAFIQAAQEMAWPIIASTATTLAAFLPLLFWPGIVGEFMKFMPLTLIFTLSASLAMALIFLPTIGAKFPRPPVVSTAENSLPFYVLPYEKFLSWALKRPLKVVLSVTGLFVAVIALYAFFGRGVEFFPRIEAERAQLVVHARGDLSITEQDKIMQEVESRLTALPGVKTFYVVAGNANAQRDGPSDIVGTVSLEYKNWEDGRPRSEEILAQANEYSQDLYGIRIERQEQRDGPGRGKPVQILVTAPTYALLPPVVSTLREKLESFDGTRNVDDDLPEPGIEWALDIDRAEATRAGTDLASVGTMIRLATNGAIVGTYRPGDSREELDIVARFDNPERTLTIIDELTIATRDGRVPLSHFTNRRAQPKVTVIRRVDQREAATIEADVAQGYLADTIVQAMRQKAAQLELPRGVRITFKGEDEDQKEAGNFLMKAFLVAIFIMAIILVTQFNSFYQAFIILTAVILSTTGVLLGHMIMAKPFGIIMSGLGVISLAGIVVNNNIVLIDTFNRLLANMPWQEAILETGRRRLRPVLLTAVTTIVGLMPMAFKLNIDIVGQNVQYNAPSTQWWDQLASSIIFGLAFATLLTLIITPCMLALFYRRKKG
jgi:multidrug efflux pump